MIEHLNKDELSKRIIIMWSLWDFKNKIKQNQIQLLSTADYIQKSIERSIKDWEDYYLDSKSTNGSRSQASQPHQEISLSWENGHFYVAPGFCFAFPFLLLKTVHAVGSL